MNAPMVIALDGPAGSGKSTVAKAVAARLGFEHLDTGAMYRSVAWACQQQGVPLTDVEAMTKVALSVKLHVGVDGNKKQVVMVDGVDVTDSIRTPQIDLAVGAVASAAPVRAALVAQQRKWAYERGAGVMEGRDIATAVFPDAPVKAYLTATPEERARRRSSQSGQDQEAVLADILRRDTVDSTRAVDPLQVAPGATVIDTTGLSIDQVVDRIVALVPASSKRTADTQRVSVNQVDAKTVTTTSPRQLTRPEKIVYGIAWYLTRFVTKTWIHTTYVGLHNVPPTGAYLVAPNHRSVVDFFLVGPITRRRMRYLGKDTVWDAKWFVPIANTLGGIPVSRGSVDRESMNRCIEALRGGEPLVLFPEGQRKEGLQIQELFDGVSYIALKAGVPILPIGIGGSHAVMPKGSYFPKRRKVTVIVGEPIYPSDPNRSVRKAAPEMTAVLHARLQSLYDEALRLTD
jgi:pantoate ligase / CMP/dCMP kinase